MTRSRQGRVSVLEYLCWQFPFAIIYFHRHGETIPERGCATAGGDVVLNVLGVLG